MKKFIIYRPDSRQAIIIAADSLADAIHDSEEYAPRFQSEYDWRLVEVVRYRGRIRSGYLGWDYTARDYYTEGWQHPHVID